MPHKLTDTATMHSPNRPFFHRTSRSLVPALALLVAGLTTMGTAQAGDTAAQMELGRQLFIVGAKPACAICHTLKEADSEGTIGPVLDELKPEASRVTKALLEGVGAMPSFRDTLTDAQIAALALYVSKASRGEK